VQIGDRVVVQVRVFLGRVGTIVEIDHERVGVRLDDGAATIWCRLSDVAPLK
jgi:hypothetical protein